jgi:hypothetical protein
MPWTTPRTWTAGSIVTAAQLNVDIRDNLNYLKASPTFDGVLTVAGFGTHAFSASGAGAHTLRVRNTGPGVANFASVAVQGDGATTDTHLQHFSTTYTSAADIVADGARLYTSGPGGWSISSVHASGAIRFYVGGTTEAMRIHASRGVSIGSTTDPGAGSLIVTGKVLINETSDANVTNGLVINQGIADDYILTLKSSDVQVTNGAIGEQDTFGAFQKCSLTLGGLAIVSQIETTTTTDWCGIFAYAMLNSGDTTKSSTAKGGISLNCAEDLGVVGANKNLVVVRNDTSAKFILDSDGDSHQDVGTAWTNFDEFDDVALLTALSVGVSRDGNPLRQHFATLLEQHRPALERARVVTFNDDGHHFVNWSRLHMLTIGAIRQQAAQIAELTRTLTDVRARLNA